MLRLLLAASLAADGGAAVPADDERLATLYAEDQADRRGAIDWAKVRPRDVARRQEVEALLAKSAAKTGRDFFHAAMVFQHGDTVGDLARARDLATEAVRRDATLTTAKWLVAAATDRWLMRQDLPQRYGTQFVRGDAGWSLYAVDPSVSDDERLDAGVPPLADARRRADELNARLTATPRTFDGGVQRAPP
jgi:hypothetical protein